MLLLFRDAGLFGRYAVAASYIHAPALSLSAEPGFRSFALLLSSILQHVLCSCSKLQKLVDRFGMPMLFVPQ